MKKLLVLVLLTLAGSVSAQFTKGSWEMGLSGSISNLKSGSTSSESQTALSISVSPAYYIVDGFSIEPEVALFLNFDESDEKGYQLLLNAGYTFKTTKSFAPYIKAGYGFGNLVTVKYGGTQGIPGRTLTDETLSIVNGAIGIKWLLGERAAIKTELNYHDQTYTSETYNTDRQYRNIGLLFGLSVFL